MTTPYALTTRRIVSSEWAKLWTLRSTWIALAVASVVTIGLSMLIGGTYSPGEADSGDIDPVQLALLGTQFGQIVIAVLGILFTAGEYSTGMIRSSLTAVPRRLPVLWAKAGVYAAVSLAVLLATVFLAFPLSQLFLGGTDMEASLADPGVVRALTGTAVGLTLIGTLALSLGAILRSIPGAIGAYIGGLVVLPELGTMVPVDAVKDAMEYFPIRASESLMTLNPGPDTLSTSVALLTLGAWVVAGLSAAALLLKRRDV